MLQMLRKLVLLELQKLNLIVLLITACWALGRRDGRESD